MTTPSRPRKTPCSSCPYRKSVPSGVWDAEEYAKLPEYDRPTWEQPVVAFGCHQGDGAICAGWLGYADPTELLAVRLGVINGHLDPSCAEYTTSVPLFESGAAAAEHGMREIRSPQGKAVDTIEKIVRKRGL